MTEVETATEPEAVGAEEITQIMESTEIPPSSNDEKFRSIVVENLRHPGSWTTNRQFQKLLNRAANFTVTFQRENSFDERQVKSGKLEILFATPESARDAFTVLQKLVIDGKRPVTLVDPEFFTQAISTSSAQFFEISDDARLLFLLNLPKSVDVHLITHFFNDIAPVHFSTLDMPQSSELLQAEVLMESEEVAKQIAQGVQEFEINQDGVDYKVVLLTPREYASYSRMEDVRRKPAVKPTVATSDAALAPEIDEDEILNRLLEIIDERRLNFAEINEKSELYELLDTVSAQYNGIPDAILKPAMGSVLQRHLNRTEMHWMREHIEGLLRMWKAEIMSEEPFQRATFVPMEAVDYQPVAEDKRSESKGAKKRQKAAKAQMGVAAFLNANRERLLVETGEMEVDSDDDGNVVIGGEALSFDSWARITKTKASGVVRANEDGTKKIGNGGLTKKQQRMARAVEGMDQEEWRKWRKEKTHSRRAEIKQRIMQQGAMEEGENEESEAPASSEPAPSKKELDEGEIDSEEERKEAQAPPAKKLRASSDSSSSSSSSSEDDPDGPVDARKRRKLRRKKERKNPFANNSSSQQASLNPEFKAMFENRKAIIAQMTPAHKAAFANALQQFQIAQSNNSASSQTNASQMINSMMSGFK